MPKLTARQELYAVALASGTLSQSAAYRQAGYGGKSSASTINECASRLAKKDSKVDARVSELRAQIMQAPEYDLAALQADFKHVAARAIEAGQFAAAVRALEQIGRMMGAFPRLDVVVRHSGRGAVQDAPMATTMTAERAHGILGESKEQARVP